MSLMVTSTWPLFNNIIITSCYQLFQMEKFTSHTGCRLVSIIYTKDYFNESRSKTGEQESSTVLQVRERERKCEKQG